MKPSTPPPQLILLAGLTGSGKTDILHSLQRKHYPIVDLEALAGHKGSVFGHFGMDPIQPSQPVFEQQLQDLCMQYANAPFVFTEQEAPAIGKRRIPAWFYTAMQRAPVIYIELPFEERVKKLVAAYAHFPDEMILAAIGRLQERLPASKMEEYRFMITQGDHAAFTANILSYYDNTRHYETGNAAVQLSFEAWDEENITAAVLQQVHNVVI